MNSSKQVVAGLALVFLGAGTASAATPRRLTAKTAATYARNDAMAAVGSAIPGTKIQVSGCHPLKGGAYSCKVVVVPAQSTSRPRWTDTIRLVHGKAVISYSNIVSQ